MATASEFRIDPETGDYTLDADGRPRTTNDLTQAAYIRLRAHFGRWLYDQKLGSSLYRLTTNSKARTGIGSDLVAQAQRALQPLIQDGRASSTSVRLIERVRFGRRIGVSITDARTDLVNVFEMIVPIG